MEFIFATKLEMTEKRSVAGNCRTPQFPGQLLPQEINLQDKHPGNFGFMGQGLQGLWHIKTNEVYVLQQKISLFFAFC